MMLTPGISPIQSLHSERIASGSHAVKVPKSALRSDGAPSAGRSVGTGALAAPSDTVELSGVRTTGKTGSSYRAPSLFSASSSTRANASASTSSERAGPAEYSRDAASDPLTYAMMYALYGSNGAAPTQSRSAGLSRGDGSGEGEDGDAVDHVMGSRTDGRQPGGQDLGDVDDAGEGEDGGEGGDAAAAKGADGEQLSDAEQRQVEKLKLRDQEVRQHEQAHKAAGGAHAGGISYEYQLGPDGLRYAVGGEVSIDISAGKDPAATVQKMQQVRSAALAPAEPSSQDRSVAAQATKLEAQARQELNQERIEEANGEGEAGGESGDKTETGTENKKTAGESEANVANRGNSANGVQGDDGATASGGAAVPSARLSAMNRGGYGGYGLSGGGLGRMAIDIIA